MEQEELINKIMEEEKTLEGTPNPVERKIGRPKKDTPNIVVPISMPKELKERIDNDEEGKINRSKFVCKAIDLLLKSEEATNYIPE